MTEKPNKPAVPSLDVEDRRPVAGRILGPSGETLKVVRHGEEPPPFGFHGGES